MKNKQKQKKLKMFKSVFSKKSKKKKLGNLKKR